MPRKRRKSSFVHANMMDIMKRQHHTGHAGGVGSPVPSRRGGMQNGFRPSECMRAGELIISPVTGKGAALKCGEDKGEDNDDDNDVTETGAGEEAAETEAEGNLTTGDISDGEVYF